MQAFNAVTIHVRVDGELKKAAFTEGQDVQAGDLLAQIDPDPFRAQLEQAEAEKAQDEAQLVNAKLDLARSASEECFRPCSSSVSAHRSAEAYHESRHGKHGSSREWIAGAEFHHSAGMVKFILTLYNHS